jgi:hypothetical protein
MIHASAPKLVSRYGRQYDSLMRRLFNWLALGSLAACIILTILAVGNVERVRQQIQDQVEQLNSETSELSNRISDATAQVADLRKTPAGSLSKEDAAQIRLLNDTVNRLLPDQTRLLRERANLMVRMLVTPHSKYIAPMAICAILPLVWLLLAALEQWQANAEMKLNLEPEDRRDIKQEMKRRIWSKWQFYVAFVVSLAAGYPVPLVSSELWRESMATTRWILAMTICNSAMLCLIAYVTMTPIWSREYRRILIAHSRCTRCGYDLRSISHCCPERGAAD